MASPLLTGKALSLSHMSSRVNMASESQTRTCLEYFVMVIEENKKIKPKGLVSNHAISSAVTATKLLLCCVNMQMKNNSNKKEKCVVKKKNWTFFNFWL